MRTLILKLSGPLQSWGAASKFRVRETERAPTKSGVIGLVAAALGRQRGESLEDLAALEYAVRVDQPGHLLRDYQTAIDWHASSKSGSNPRLSTRLYLADAVFIAALSGPESFIDQLAEAIQRPAYPLFLGRRACPAPSDLFIGLRSEEPLVALSSEPWHASNAYQRKHPDEVSLTVFRDARPGERGDRMQDVPVSFAQEHRRYSWREVMNDDPVRVPNRKGIQQQDLFFTEVTNS